MAEGAEGFPGGIIVREQALQGRADAVPVFAGLLFLPGDRRFVDEPLHGRLDDVVEVDEGIESAQELVKVLFLHGRERVAPGSVKEIVEEIDEAAGAAVAVVNVEGLEDGLGLVAGAEVVEAADEFRGARALVAGDEAVAPLHAKEAAEHALGEAHEAAFHVEVPALGRGLGSGAAEVAQEQPVVLRELAVAGGEQLQVVGDALVAGDADERGEHRLQKIGSLLAGRGFQDFGVGLDVEKAALHGAVGVARGDGADGVGEGFVVEHAAVEEPRGFAEIAPLLEQAVGGRRAARRRQCHLHRGKGGGEARRWRGRVWPAPR